MSMTMICETIMAKLAPAPAWAAVVLVRAASTSLWISRVALTSRKKPPASRTRSRREKAWPASSKSGRLRWISQNSRLSRAMRKISASARPSWRACFDCSGGSRPTITEMKMMLSMPRTISMTVSVTKLARIAGSAIHSRRDIAGS